MSFYSIIVVNTAPGCNTEIDQQLSVTGCTSYLVRLAPNSNATGPFNLYIDSTGTTPYYSALTRTQLLIGVVVNIDCPTATPTVTPTVTPSSQTPSPTPTYTATPSQTATVGTTPPPTNTPTVTQTSTPSNTPTLTVTPSQTATLGATPQPTLTPSQTPSNTPTNTFTPTTTPTNTVTPSMTPTNTSTPTTTPTNTVTPSMTPTPSSASFFAYLFPEPQDSTSLNDLGQYLYDVGATWYGFGNMGVPGTSNYSTNMNLYAQYSGWTGNSGNFITPVTTLKSPIRQSSGSGTDGYGCPQNQYTFGTIQVTTSQVNPSVFYFYTIWIPLNGVGGTMNNMTVDMGLGSACSTSIINDGIPDGVLASTSATISGAAIPDGTYRILWMYPQTQQPNITPLLQSIYFKGDTKT